MTQLNLKQDGSRVAGNNEKNADLIYIIDDDAHIRKSLHFLLPAFSWKAWPFASATDFLDQLANLAPGPILLDIRMPDIDGIQLLSILKERGVNWPVIVMTAHGDIPVAVQAMKAGATEFLEKPFAADMLRHALDQAFGVLDRSAHEERIRDVTRRLLNRLSNREREVLAILIKGSPNKLVGHQLGISIRTVEMHRGNALAKLEVRTIAEVMALLAAAEITLDQQSEIE